MNIANFTQIEFNNKYEEIYKSVISGINPEIHTKAYILGGQPGAGKSRLNQYIKYFNDNNVAIINGDEYRKYHPHFREILDYYGDDFPKYTSSFSSQVTEKLIEVLSDKKYNLCIEGTLRTTTVPISTCNLLKSKGYNVELDIMATKEKISYLSTQLRYYNFLSKGMIARATPKEHHDMVVKSICTNLNEIYNKKVFDDIKIFNRELEIIFNNKNKILPGDFLSEFYKSTYSKNEIESLKNIIYKLNQYTDLDYTKYLKDVIIKDNVPKKTSPLGHFHDSKKLIKHVHDFTNSDIFNVTDELDFNVDKNICNEIGDDLVR